MARQRWIDLPCPVRAAVEALVGPVRSHTDISIGQNNDMAVRLDRADGTSVFVKGVHGGGRPVMFLGNEAESAARAPGIAPTVQCVVEQDGWLVVGFDFVAGRSAVLAPGSPDLALVGQTMDKIAALPAGGARPLSLRWRNTEIWSAVAPGLITEWDVAEMIRWSALVPEHVEGDRLVHTDLHGDQFIISDTGAVHVIDWGFPGAGPAWVDTAFLVLRLIDAGHTAAAAEAWARTRLGWTDVPPPTITAWAAYIAGLWSGFAPTAGTDRRARIARDYAALRVASPDRWLG